MWTLILILKVPFYNGHANYVPAMTSVPGFADRSLCETAKRSLEKEADDKVNGVCVRTQKL